MRALALAAAALAVPLAGCSDDAVCGPDPTTRGDGVTVAGDGATFRYGTWQAGANNDCPAPDTPANVISVTVYGTQADPAGAAVFTLCLPRPDRIEPGVAIPLDPANSPVEADDRVQLIELEADRGGGCRWALDLATPPTGTATFERYCGDGTEAGFELTFDGAATVIETCPGQPARSIEVTLDGTTAVAPWMF